MKKVLALALVLLSGSAAAQGTFPLNNVPIGKGPGKTGFTAVAPGANGTCLVIVAGVPTFASCLTALTGAALTKTDDTNVTLILGGSPSTALVNAASLTLGWTGTLAISRGGSGAGTQQGLINAAHNCPPTRAGDLAYYNGTNWVCLAGNNTGTRVLQEDSAGTPSWTTVGAGTVTSVGLTNTYGLTVTGSPVTNTGNINAEVNLTSSTLSLGANINMNGTLGLYVDGPTATNSTTGTWFASGTVTINDSSASAANFYCKLYDGVSKIAASTNVVHPAAANLRTSVSLSGIINAPAGNIRIACAPQDTTTGVMEFNRTGNSKDSTVTAFRIN